MTPDPVVRRKVAIIERCLERVRSLTGGNPASLDDQTIEDAVILNLQRACEASIDAAMRLVSRRRLGLPQDSRQAFTLLEKDSVLTPEMSDRMRKMVGFRNIAIHAYEELDRDIIKAIATRHLGDFEDYSRAVMNVDDTEG